MIIVGTREIIQTIAIVSSAHTSTNVVVTKEKKMNEIRLIDANALKEEIDKIQYTREFCVEHQIDYSISMQMVGLVIDNAPTVPQTIITEFKGCDNCELERPLGEWIDEGQYAEGHSEHAYTCKKCGYQIIELPSMIFENRFCKNCGAEMRGEKK